MSPCQVCKGFSWNNLFNVYVIESIEVQYFGVTSTLMASCWEFYFLFTTGCLVSKLSVIIIKFFNGQYFTRQIINKNMYIFICVSIWIGVYLLFIILFQSNEYLNTNSQWCTIQFCIERNTKKLNDWTDFKYIPSVNF